MPEHLKYLPIVLVLLPIEALARGCYGDNCGKGFFTLLVSVVLIGGLFFLLASIGAIFNKTDKKVFSEDNIWGGFFVLLAILFLVGLWQGSKEIVVTLSVMYGLPILLVYLCDKRKNKHISKNTLFHKNTSECSVSKKSNLDNFNSDIKISNHPYVTDAKNHKKMVKDGTKPITQDEIEKKLIAFREKRRQIESKKNLVDSKKINESASLTMKSLTTYIINNKKHFFDGEKFIPIDD